MSYIKIKILPKPNELFFIIKLSKINESPNIKILPKPNELNIAYQN
jgi:hypothetical protein